TLDRARIDHDLQLRSSTTCARKTPMPAISTSSRSPGFIHSGGALANDERKLALEVEIVGHFGANPLAAMPDQCVGKARLFRQFARHLRRMRAIIDAGAENLPRLRDYRQKFYVVELAIRRGALRDAAHLFHRAGSERRAETGLPDFI